MLAVETVDGGASDAWILKDKLRSLENRVKLTLPSADKQLSMLAHSLRRGRRKCAYGKRKGFVKGE